MKTGRLSSLLVLVAAGIGVASCITDNPAAYQGMLGPTRKEPAGPKASAGSAGTGGTAGAATAGGPQSGSGGAHAGESGTGEGGGE